METVKYIWMDGTIVPWEEARIHVLTHALHYGSGVFEGIRFYKTDKGPAIFRHHEHIKRLFYSALALEMKIPYSENELRVATHELIKKNDIEAGYIRPIVYYGYGKMGLNPKGAPVNVAIAVWPWEAYLGHDMVKVKVSQYIRIHPQSSEIRAKICGHYVNSILASLEAHNLQYDEALFLDFEGNVAEGPGENIFMVKNGELFTPPPCTILPGITRDSVKSLTAKLGLAFHEKMISLEYLKEADELFFTGTAAEVTGISEVDDTRIADGRMGSITQKIKKLYLDIVHGREKEYFSWLDFVF